MIDLDIGNFDDFNEGPVTWQKAASVEKQTTANVDTPKIEMSNRETDIFDLARSISNRANSGRRLRRASSIF